MKKPKHYLKALKHMPKWEKRKLMFWFAFIVLLGCLFLGYTGRSLYTDRVAEDVYWTEGLLDDATNLAEANTLNQRATTVTAGTYVENLNEVNIKNSYFRIVFNCWFRWEDDDSLDMLNNFRVYNGTINQMEVLADYVDGSTHYQSARVDVSISKNYWTTRFPLESYQLRIYLESLYPVDEVMLLPDQQYSSVNPGMKVSGFDLERNAVSVYTMKYENSKNDPEDQTTLHQELVTSLEINRSNLGLYLKCFIALFGTLTWTFITLFICTYHKVDPLTMLPAALFGTVTNIMVGANLLPDTLQLGLLEYVNLAGVIIILLVALTIISINRTRSKYNKMKFAFLYGRIMFYTLLTFTLIGIVWFPLMAYKF